jgi:lipopolysaccharide transport system ATP-binding protein
VSAIAIEIDGLSKEYRLGATRAYKTLRESITEGAKSLLGRGKGQKKPQESFMALDNVSFQVKPGETVGLIGRNGAGKSTLLKVLSRITEPTAGRARIYGRIGSLLEVGTGFHGELSGRENIYLNGAILGMKRADIERHFDSIVDFAEVEKFIDTPVKHYSSGMYLRLAFAVAAHLEPEILMIDEVLAVGDMSFQKKCLGKMGEVAKQGRTILFVSHNMAAVRALCDRGVVLDKGRLVEEGPIGKAIEAYYRLTSTIDATEQTGNRSGFGKVWLTSHPALTIEQQDAFEVATTINIPGEVTGFSMMLILNDMHQRNVVHLRRDSPVFKENHRWHGRYDLRAKLPPLWLEPGLYSMHFKVLFWGSVERERFVSDTVNLDVGGEASGWGAVLTPECKRPNP